jgi:hypothetical protein
MVKTHKHLAALCATLVLGSLALAPLTATAGTEVSSKDGKGTVAKEEPVTKSLISGDLGFVATSDYFSRGILQTASTGVKFQPYLDLYFKLYEGDGFVNNVTFAFGLWSNLETKVGGPGVNTKFWEEFDYTAGFAITFAKNFTATISYFEFDSPNQSFNEARSMNLNLSYNDADLLGMWALHPHVTFLQELDGHAGMGMDGSKRSQYYEVGIAPSFTFMKESKYAPTLTLPLTAGFGSSGFYGTGFGYASAGGTISVPLAFIPAGYGAWTWSVGGTYYYLGKTTAAAAGPLTFSNGSRHNAGVAFTSVGLTF